MLQSVLEACCKHLFEMFHLFQTYVASVCFKYFRYSRNMLEVFHIDVAKLIGNAYVVKCFKGMLQAFVQNISSVSDVCCKHFI
jgi:hypothetical protein